MAAVLSNRHKRRLRLNIAKRLVNNSLQNKKMRLSDDFNLLRDGEPQVLGASEDSGSTEDDSESTGTSEDSDSTVVCSNEKTNELSETEHDDSACNITDDDSSNDGTLLCDEFDTSSELSDAIDFEEELEFNHEVLVPDGPSQQIDLLSASSSVEFSVAFLLIALKHSMTYACVTDVLGLGLLLGYRLPVLFHILCIL